MENNGSISEFFYNIVPGALFLFLLKLNGLDIIRTLWRHPDPTFTIFIYIISGLFLGFVFQGITKFVRNHGWNEQIIERVFDGNEEIFKESYIHIYKYKLKKYSIPTKKQKEIAFYLMDNAISGDHAAFLRTHFSSRFAFWSNMLFATLSLILIKIIYCQTKTLDFLLFVIFAFFCWWIADQYFAAFYDVILKSYYMLKVVKD